MLLYKDIIIYLSQFCSSLDFYAFVHSQKYILNFFGKEELYSFMNWEDAISLCNWKMLDYFIYNWNLDYKSIILFAIKQGNINCLKQIDKERLICELEKIDGNIWNIELPDPMIEFISSLTPKKCHLSMPGIIAHKKAFNKMINFLNMDVQHVPTLRILKYRGDWSEMMLRSVNLFTASLDYIRFWQEELGKRFEDHIDMYYYTEESKDIREENVEYLYRRYPSILDIANIDEYALVNFDPIRSCLMAKVVGTSGKCKISPGNFLDCLFDNYNLTIMILKNQALMEELDIKDIILEHLEKERPVLVSRNFSLEALQLVHKYNYNLFLEVIYCGEFLVALAMDRKDIRIYTWLKKIGIFNYDYFFTLFKGEVKDIFHFTRVVKVLDPSLDLRGITSAFVGDGKIEVVYGRRKILKLK